MLFCFCLGAQAQDSLKMSGIDLENYDYPFPVEYLKLSLQNENLQMAYMDIRPRQYNGKNVLLLHGKNFNGAYWEQTAKALAQAGYRVIIPDQIGFGKSTKPVSFQYSFHQLAENTWELLDKLGIEKLRVIGHSMGGMLATRFALMYPEITEQLVLVNPIGLEDYKTVVPYQTVDRWYKKELAATYGSMKEYQQKSYYGNSWKPEYDRWLNMTAGWTLNPEYPIIAWNSALTYDMIMTQPVCYEFSQLSCPVLLIIGQRDRTAVGKDMAPENQRDRLGQYPQLGKKTKDVIPHCELVELEGLGHLPHIEAFDRFIQPLLKFLGER